MAMEQKITLTIAKADVGGLVGHTSSHPNVLDTARERLFNAKEKGVIADFHVLRCGDDLDLVLTHGSGRNDIRIHELLWNIFLACAEVAKELKLHRPGEDLLKDAFTGNLGDMGPNIAEMEFFERQSEPVIIFFSNKTGPGTWNLPAYKIFADPFSSTGLIMSTEMMKGFTFNVLDIKEGKEVALSTPAEIYELLALIGNTGRYAVQSVYRNYDQEIAAVISARKLELLNGKRLGKSCALMAVRCQSGLPSSGEALEPFTSPHLVSGWMWGAHSGPLVPVPFYEANAVRFDGPPRVIAAGFQIADGRLIGPHDMFDDPAFDRSRKVANLVCDYMRRHGPFQPHKLPSEEMEYSSMPFVLDKLRDRFKKA